MPKLAFNTCAECIWKRCSYRKSRSGCQNFSLTVPDSYKIGVTIILHGKYALNLDREEIKEYKDIWKRSETPYIVEEVQKLRFQFKREDESLEEFGKRLFDIYFNRVIYDDTLARSAYPEKLKAIVDTLASKMGLSREDLFGDASDLQVILTNQIEVR